MEELITERNCIRFTKFSGNRNKPLISTDSVGCFQDKIGNYFNFLSVLTSEGSPINGFDKESLLLLVRTKLRKRFRPLNQEAIVSQQYKKKMEDELNQIHLQICQQTLVLLFNLLLLKDQSCRFC